MKSKNENDCAHPAIQLKIMKVSFEEWIHKKASQDRHLNLKGC
jgi:hypothetical protein